VSARSIATSKASNTSRVSRITSVPSRKFAGILRLRTPMRVSGGPARRRHASQMRSSSFHPFLRLDPRTGSLRLPATICSSNFRDRTLGLRTILPRRSARRWRALSPRHENSRCRTAVDVTRTHSCCWQTIRIRHRASTGNSESPGDHEHSDDQL
jgi:hypothetical protein